MHGLTAPIQHVHLTRTLWLIPLLPLLGAAANAFFGTRIQARFGKRGVATVAIGVMVVALTIALLNFASLVRLPDAERYLLDHRWTMIRLGSLDVNFALAMDPLSGLMTLIITGIGTLIHVYASAYMETEPSYWRFFCYLNLFIFSMLLLVLGENFFVMFFGWEGVGLCSYLLIGFWHKDYNKASAGMKAFVVNRVGDWGFVVGLMLLFWSLGGSWGLSVGMETEYTRRNPQPAGVMPSDLDVDDDTASIGPSLYPVEVTEPVHEGHEGGAHEAPHGPAAPGAPGGHAAPPGQHGSLEQEKTAPQDWLAQMDHSHHGDPAAIPGAHPPPHAQSGLPPVPPHVGGGHGPLPSMLGKGFLTMTAWPGAKVFLRGGTEPSAVSPFVKLEVNAGLLDVEIEQQPNTPRIRLKHVRITANGEVALAPVGPTVSFRALRDQFAIQDPTHRRFVQKAMDPSAPGHKTIWGVSVLTLACICFFVGATGKSAQIPLYVWLPDAMAGPTPVSALIHAATMVTAGVYMIARLSFLFSLSPAACAVVATVGALTALFAATIGFFQMDIKKVLAYSTVSQLGFMFIGVGVGAYWAGVFHLMTHAFFKACLFLGSGSVIHGMHAVEHDADAAQDMRNMGGLKKVMPWTARTYFIACLAITAAPIPLFAGFWSKDEILWKAFTTQNLWEFESGFPLGKLIYGLGLAAAMCTSFYMWRSYYLTFEGTPRKKEVLTKVHESPIAMTYVLWALAGLSTIGGVLFGLSKNFFHLGMGPKEPLLEEWLHPSIDLVSINGQDRAPRFAEPGSSVEIGLMVLSVGLALVSWRIAKTKYGAERSATWDTDEAKLPGYRLTQNKYWVDEIYRKSIIAFVLRLRLVLGQFDRYVVDGLVNFSGIAMRSVSWINGKIDYLFVDGAVRAVSEGLLVVGGKVRKVQSGKIQSYVLAALGGVAIFALIAQLVR